MGSTRNNQKNQPSKPKTKAEAQAPVQLRQTQNNYVNTVLQNDITFCYGPAGTSKTFTACYIALELLKKKEINKIILCKPIQEAGEKLGFLPGSIDEKVDPYMKSYKSNIEKIVGWSMTEELFGDGIIEFQPLAYMRGDTYDNSLMILDEAQNADFRQLMLFITRMGKNTKVIVAGDVSQHDIAKNKVSLPSFIEMLKGIKGIGTHIFTDKDIVRAKILQEVVKRYDDWKDKNNL
jgi:phosphate starvation-inducible PhoH-like protein